MTGGDGGLLMVLDITYEVSIWTIGLSATVQL
jgi:hypothetical protein